MKTQQFHQFKIKTQQFQPKQIGKISIFKHLLVSFLARAWSLGVELNNWESIFATQSTRYSRNQKELAMEASSTKQVFVNREGCVDFTVELSKSTSLCRRFFFCLFCYSSYWPQVFFALLPIGSKDPIIQMSFGLHQFFLG